MQQRRTNVATNAIVKKGILKHKKTVSASKSFSKSYPTNPVHNNIGKSEIDAIFDNLERLKVSKTAPFRKGKPLDNSHCKAERQLTKGSNRSETFHHFKNRLASETNKKFKDLDQNTHVKISSASDNKSYQSADDSLPSIKNSSLVSSGAPNMIVDKKKQLWEKEKEEIQKMGDYNPWGRGGSGAPMKDQYGNSISTEYIEKETSSNNLPNIHTAIMNVPNHVLEEITAPRTTPPYSQQRLQQQNNQNNHQQHVYSQPQQHDFGDTIQNVSHQGIITNFNYDNKQLTTPIRDNNNLYGRKRGEHKIISGVAMKSFIYGTDGNVEELKRREKEEDRKKDMEYRECLRLQIEEKKRQKKGELEKERWQEETEHQRTMEVQQQLLDQRQYVEQQQQLLRQLEGQQFLQRQQQFVQQNEQEHPTHQQLQQKQHFKQKHKQQQFLQQQQCTVGPQQFVVKDPPKQRRRVSIVTDDYQQLDEKFNQENLERARIDAIKFKDLNKIKTMAQNGHNVSKRKADFEAKYGPIDIDIPCNDGVEERPTIIDRPPPTNHHPPTIHQIREEHPLNNRNFVDKLNADLNAGGDGSFMRASYMVNEVAVSENDTNKYNANQYNKNTNKKGILKNNVVKYSNKNVENVESCRNNINTRVTKVTKENIDDLIDDLNTNKRFAISQDNHSDEYVNYKRSDNKGNSTNQMNSSVTRSSNKGQMMELIDNGQALYQPKQPSKHVRHNDTNMDDDQMNSNRNINTSETYNQQKRLEQQEKQHQYLHKQLQQDQQQLFYQQNQQRHRPSQSTTSPDTHNNDIKHSTTDQHEVIKCILDKVKDNLLERATTIARLDRYAREDTKQHHHHHQQRNLMQQPHNQQQLPQYKQQNVMSEQLHVQQQVPVNRLKIHSDDNDYETGDDDDDDDDDGMEEYAKKTDPTQPMKSTDVFESKYSKVERMGGDDDDGGSQQIHKVDKSSLERSFLRLKQGLSAKQMKWSTKL